MCLAAPDQDRFSPNHVERVVLNLMSSSWPPAYPPYTLYSELSSEDDPYAPGAPVETITKTAAATACPEPRTTEVNGRMHETRSHHHQHGKPREHPPPGGTFAKPDSPDGQ